MGIRQTKSMNVMWCIPESSPPAILAAETERTPQSSGNVSLHDPTSHGRNTPRQSRPQGLCRGDGHCPRRCPSRKERNICSNVVGTAGLTTVGGRLCVSLTHCCSSFSTSGTSDFGAGSSAVVSTRRSRSSNWCGFDLCPVTVATLVVSML